MSISDPAYCEKRLSEIVEKIKNFFAEFFPILEQNQALAAENGSLKAQIKKYSLNAGKYEDLVKRLKAAGINVK